MQTWSISRKSIPLAFTQYSSSHVFTQKSKRHNTPKTLVNSAEQLSKCFFSCAFLRGVSSVRCQREHYEVKKCTLECFFLSSLLHWTLLESSLQMDTCCAVSSWKHHGLHLGRHTVEAGGLYWRLKQQRLLKSASGTMRRSWQLVIHGAFTAHATPLSLHICLCICTSISQSYSVLRFMFAYIINCSKVKEFHEYFYT